MKFDKDFAVKQKFWLLLAGAAFFMVVGIFVLFFIAPRATATIKDKVKKDWDSFKKPGDVKNPLFVEEARKRADIEEKKKTEVWKLAAKDQERLFTWPAELAKSTNGLRAIEVNVVGKDPAKLNELNDDTNPDKGVHTFHGILQKQTNPEWIVVSKTTKEGKPVSRTFYRTPKVKVVAPEKDKEFKDLNAFDGSVVSVVYQRGVYSYDELTDSEQGIFANDKKGYRTQLLDVLKEAGPLNELDELVVQSRMDPSAVTRTGREGAVMPPPIVPGPRGTTDLKWAFKKDGKLPPSNNRVFHWVEKWERGDRGRDDISEEVWLAQEDLWIYRELFRLVKKANDYVANFEQIEGGKPGDAKFVGENPYLKIALSLEGDDKKQVKIQLTNKLNSLQPLTSQFAVQLTPGGEYKVLKPLDAPALLPAGPDAKGKDSSEEKTLDLRVAYPVKGIYGVRQVLTWETAAVKRIDQICIGTVGGEEWSLPHRLAHKLPLLAFFKKEVAATEQPDPKAMPDNKQPPGGIRTGPRGELVQGAERTLNGLVRDRYLEKTPQSRRVPVAIALIVDQAQVSRVQAAFANSALRFVTTQVLVHRYPFPVRPEEPPEVVDEKTGQVAKGMPFGPSGSRPFGSGSGDRFPAFGERPPVGPGRPYIPPYGMPTQPGAATGGEDQESNVELVLYGVVSIYERYPPRGGVAEQPPGTPAPTPAPAPAPPAKQ